MDEFCYCLQEMQQSKGDKTPEEANMPLIAIPLYPLGLNILY